MRLFKEDEVKAREYFNEHLYTEYYNNLVFSGESALRRFFFFYVTLDEYLNSSDARYFGVVSKELVLDSYQSEYLDELKELEREKRK